jgi:hypothetical protein
MEQPLEVKQSIERINELNKEDLPVQFGLHAIAKVSFKGIDVTPRISAAFPLAFKEKSTLSENAPQTTQTTSRSWRSLLAGALPLPIPLSPRFDPLAYEPFLFQTSARQTKAESTVFQPDKNT